MRRIRSTTTAIALFCLALAAPASAQTGVVDQDNTLKDNVGWNMGYFKDMQQDVKVGITGQMEGFLIRMGSDNAALGLPVAIFAGYGPHAPTATPLWSGTAYAPYASFSYHNVFVDVSPANLFFNQGDVFTIRVGDGVNVSPGRSLVGNEGFSTVFYPYYTEAFHEDQVAQNSIRLHFRTWVIGCSGQATKYGQGCPGPGQIVPELLLYGCPAPGENVTLEIKNGNGGATALLLFGLGKGQFPLGGGCDLLLSPVLPGPQLFLPLGGSGPGNGSLALPGFLPPTLPAVTVTMQVFVLDSSPLGGAGTNGLEMVIQ